MAKVIKYNKISTWRIYSELTILGTYRSLSMATSINMQEIPRFTDWEIYNTVLLKTTFSIDSSSLIRTAKCVPTTFPDQGVTLQKGVLSFAAMSVLVKGEMITWEKSLYHSKTEFWQHETLIVSESSNFTHLCLVYAHWNKIPIF